MAAILRGSVIAIDPSTVTVDRIQHTRFTTAFRGFDPEEVRAHLQAVATAYQMMLKTEAELRLQVEELAARSQIGLGVVGQVSGVSGEGSDVESESRLTEIRAQVELELRSTLTSEIRGEIDQQNRARLEDLLVAAKSQAAQIVTQANDEAARVILRARAESRGRPSAEGLAAIEAAVAESHGDPLLAKEQARVMIAEAKAVREKILTDLAKRRRVAHVQLEQMRVAKDKLADALRDARRLVDDASKELSTVETEARMAAESAGRKVNAEPLPTAGELEAELLGSRYLGVSLLGPSEALATTDAVPELGPEMPSGLTTTVGNSTAEIVKSELPAVEIHAAAVPESFDPEAQSSQKADTAELDLAEIEAPAGDTPEAEISEATTSETGTSEAITPEAITPEAETSTQVPRAESFQVEISLVQTFPEQTSSKQTSLEQTSSKQTLPVELSAVENLSGEDSDRVEEKDRVGEVPALVAVPSDASIPSEGPTDSLTPRGKMQRDIDELFATLRSRKQSDQISSKSSELAALPGSEKTEQVEPRRTKRGATILAFPQQLPPAELERIGNSGSADLPEAASRLEATPIADESSAGTSFVARPVRSEVLAVQGSVVMLGAAKEKLVRAIKRSIQDDQGVALSALRIAKSEMSVIGLVGTFEQQVERLAKGIEPGLGVLYQVAVDRSSVSGDVVASREEYVTNQAVKLAQIVAGDLRARLEIQLSKPASVELSDGVSSCYRSWTTERLSEELLGRFGLQTQTASNPKARQTS